MRVPRTFAERIAVKEKRAAQLKAAQQETRNTITYATGREMRRHQKAPLYAALSLPPEEQQPLLILLESLCSDAMSAGLRMRLLQAFTAQLDPKVLKRCERVIMGESELSQAAE